MDGVRRQGQRVFSLPGQGRRPRSRGAAGVAMSQKNVEVVRRYVETWNAEDMYGVRELYAPDGVMVAERDWPEPGPFVGRDAVMQQVSEARDAFDSDWVEVLNDPVAVGDRGIVGGGWHGGGGGPR